MGTANMKKQETSYNIQDTSYKIEVGNYKDE